MGYFIRLAEAMATEMETGQVGKTEKRGWESDGESANWYLKKQNETLRLDQEPRPTIFSTKILVLYLHHPQPRQIPIC